MRSFARPESQQRERRQRGLRTAAAAGAALSFGLLAVLYYLGGAESAADLAQTSAAPPSAALSRPQPGFNRAPGRPEGLSFASAAGRPTDAPAGGPVSSHERPLIPAFADAGVLGETVPAERGFRVREGFGRKGNLPRAGAAGASASSAPGAPIEPAWEESASSDLSEAYSQAREASAGPGARLRRGLNRLLSAVGVGESGAPAAAARAVFPQAPAAQIGSGPGALAAPGGGAPSGLALISGVIGPSLGPIDAPVPRGPAPAASGSGGASTGEAAGGVEGGGEQAHKHEGGIGDKIAAPDPNSAGGHFIGGKAGGNSEGKSGKSGGKSKGKSGGK